MSQLPPIVDSNGRPVILLHQMATGGEGAVFTLKNDESHVAKIYHRTPTIQTAEKLTAMVSLANPQLLKLSAWPKSLLYQARVRQLAGFVMPKLCDCQPIQHLYNPVQRLKCFPRCAWDFQVRAAANLAAVFDEIHKAGCLIGDVNQSNAQVSSRAMVRMIDCDSFQVQANGRLFGCEVGVAQYIPPELQGKSLRGLIRTPNHDRFGLAVLIYQLLFVGRHPYMGLRSDEAPFEELIANYRFAQGPAARSWGMAPPPHTPTFADIPPELGTLFRRAFERGSEIGTRPQPAEWLPVLHQLEKSLLTCTVDSGHKVWRGASECIWCRLARNGGPEYYFGVATGSVEFALDDGRLKEAIRRLEAVAGGFDGYNRDKYRPRKAPTPMPLPDDLEDKQATQQALKVSIWCSIGAMPFGLIHGIVFLFALFCSAVFGVWFLAISPWRQERRRRQRIRTKAGGELEGVEAEWRRVDFQRRTEHNDTRTSVTRMVGACRELSQQYHNELRRLTYEAETMARLRHLRLHSISDADIYKVGAGRKQILARHNVLTAADIDWVVIQSIRGFGEALTQNLMNWKEEVLRRFQFDPNTAVSAAQKRELAMRFVGRQKSLIDEIDKEIIKLETSSQLHRKELARLEPRIRVALLAVVQAEVDVRLVDESRRGINLRTSRTN